MYILYTCSESVSRWDYAIDLTNLNATKYLRTNMCICLMRSQMWGEKGL
jgi:hypothetical protein